MPCRDPTLPARNSPRLSPRAQSAAAGLDPALATSWKSEAVGRFRLLSWSSLVAWAGDICVTQVSPVRFRSASEPRACWRGRSACRCRAAAARRSPGTEGHPDGDEERDDLPGGVRPEECGHAVVVEGQAGGAEAEGVGGQVELSGRQRAAQVGEAVAAVAVAPQDG